MQRIFISRQKVDFVLAIFLVCQGLCRFLNELMRSRQGQATAVREVSLLRCFGATLSYATTALSSSVQPMNYPNALQATGNWNRKNSPFWIDNFLIRILRSSLITF